MEELRSYEATKLLLTHATDEIMLSYFLNGLVGNPHSWAEHFDRYNEFPKNPFEFFDSERTGFVILNPGAPEIGMIDDELGCWRIIGKQKIIRSSNSSKIIGFKKIFRFCTKRTPLRTNRHWVLEHFAKKGNQSWVICKINMLFNSEISKVLGNHMSQLMNSALPRNGFDLLPCLGYNDELQGGRDLLYLATIASYNRKGTTTTWPEEITTDIYHLHPSTVLDLYNEQYVERGMIVFVNWTEESDSDDGSIGWRTMSENPISLHNIAVGFKRDLLFWETKTTVYGRNNVITVTWSIEEFRLLQKEYRGKVMCLVKPTVTLL